MHPRKPLAETLPGVTLINVRLLRVIACAVWMVLLGVVPGHAEKRVALVIGNSAYRNAAGLANPANDATAMAEFFKSAHFDDVRLRLDLGIEDLRRAIRDFADLASGADVAVVYYAGHGIEMDGMNYLVPIDARFARDFDVDDEAVTLDRILRAMEPARRLRLVILDACRDNPFAATMKRSVASRSIGRGLARVEPDISDTLIAFSAKAGSTALDENGGRNSPFTSALLKHLAIPDLDIRLAFGRVRDEVMKSTGRKQEPFLYGSLGGEAISLLSAPLEAMPSENAQGGIGEAAQAWAATKDSTSEAVLTAFISRYDGTYYADLARVRLQELTAKTALKETAPKETDLKEQGTSAAIAKPQAQPTAAKGKYQPTNPGRTTEKPPPAHSRLAQQSLTAEPPLGTLVPGSRWLVNDGSCPAGQVKEIIAGTVSAHIPRQRRCVPH
jgi:uncharacterized caspase-like protein